MWQLLTWKWFVKNRKRKQSYKVEKSPNGVPIFSPTYYKFQKGQFENESIYPNLKIALSEK